MGEAIDKAQRLVSVMEEFLCDEPQWYQSQIVLFGGAVRDNLRGVKHNDIDIAFIPMAQCKNAEMFDAVIKSIRKLQRVGTAFGCEVKLKKSEGSYAIPGGLKRVTVVFDGDTFDLCVGMIGDPVFVVNCGEIVLKRDHQKSTVRVAQTLQTRSVRIDDFLRATQSEFLLLTPPARKFLARIREDGVEHADKAGLFQVCQRIEKMRKRGYEDATHLNDLLDLCKTDVFDGGMCMVCLEDLHTEAETHIATCCFKAFHAGCLQRDCPHCRCKQCPKLKVKSTDIP